MLCRIPSQLNFSWNLTRNLREYFFLMATKNKIHDFYDNLKVGDEGYGKKKQCKLCPLTRIDDISANALAVELRQFQDLQRLRADTDIMDFWKKQKLAFPLLSIVALTILSIPITEVDVERLFSHLTFIHSKLRNCLTSSMISNIIFLRMSSKQDFNCETDEILY